MSKPIKDWFAKTFDDWVDEGYPEEIIPDILSGDLPMDEASKAARAAEQGMGPVLWRGHPDDGHELIVDTPQCQQFTGNRGRLSLQVRLLVN